MEVSRGVGFTIAFFFGFFMSLSIFSIANQMKHTQMIDEFVVLNASSILSYPKSAKIICQEGAFVSDLPFSEDKRIYACLWITDDKCAGDGKICHVRYRVWR